MTNGSGEHQEDSINDVAPVGSNGSTSLENQMGTDDLAEKIGDAIGKALAVSNKERRQFGISDLVALISIGGMIYAFISNQSAMQTATLFRLDSLERSLAEVKKASDPIGMIQFKVDGISHEQEQAKAERIKDRDEVDSKIDKALSRFGLVPKK